MSLSREAMAELTQDLVDMYADMETELMELVAEYLKKNKSLLQTFDARDALGNVINGSVTVVQWRTRALRELGALDAEGIKLLAKYSGKTVSEVKRIYKEALDIGLIEDEAILKLGVDGGILQPAAPLAQSAIVDMLKRAQSATLTTFSQINNSMLRSAGEHYTKIVHGVETSIMSGVMTVDQAVARSVRAFAQEGLTGFVAKNGAGWTPEAYARMIIQSDLKNAVSAAQEERYKEYGNNYVEISAYAGARPKCAEDQGYIYALDDDTTPIEDLDGNTIEVRAWSSSSYGEPDGILGINCGHSRWAFVPGISTQSNRNEDIDRTENDKKYKERQQQRYIERNIREAKREKVLLQEAGAPKRYIEDAQAKVSEWQDRATKFVSETNGTRYYDREQIYVNSSLLDSSGSGTIRVTNGLSDYDARLWYKRQNAKIKDQIDTSQSIESQARQAHAFRNDNRTYARRIMADHEKAAALDMSDPNMTFDELLDYKKESYGLTDQEAYESIIESSRRSRKSVDKSFGLEDYDV